MFTFGPVDYVLDQDDLPQWSDPYARIDLLRQPDGPQMVWEHAPAAEAPPSVYPADLGRPLGKGDCPFVWSSLLAEIERDPAGEREDAA